MMLFRVAVVVAVASVINAGEMHHICANRISDSLLKNKEVELKRCVACFERSLLVELDYKLSFRQLPYVMRRAANFALTINSLSLEEKVALAREISHNIILDTDTLWMPDALSDPVMRIFVDAFIEVFVKEKCAEAYQALTYRKEFCDYEDYREFANELIDRLSDKLDVDDLVFVVRSSIIFSNKHHNREDRAEAVKLVIFAVLDETSDDIPVGRQVLKNLCSILIEAILDQLEEDNDSSDICPIPKS